MGEQLAFVQSISSREKKLAPQKFYYINQEIYTLAVWHKLKK